MLPVCPLVSFTGVYYWFVYYWFVYYWFVYYWFVYYWVVYYWLSTTGCPLLAVYYRLSIASV